MGHEEVLDKLLIGRADQLQKALEGQVLPQAADALVVEQGQILDLEEDPQDDEVDRQAEDQQEDLLQPFQNDLLCLGLPLQSQEDHGEQGQRHGDGQVGLVGPHGAGQDQDAGEDAEAVTGGQPDGKDRQQNAEAVGRGRKQVEIGEGHRGEDDHQGPDEAADESAPHPEQGDRQA